jgi:hypothetical protein
MMGYVIRWSDDRGSGRRDARSCEVLANTWEETSRWLGYVAEDPRVRRITVSRPSSEDRWGLNLLEWYGRRAA